MIYVCFATTRHGTGSPLPDNETPLFHETQAETDKSSRIWRTRFYNASSVFLFSKPITDWSVNLQTRELFLARVPQMVISSTQYHPQYCIYGSRLGCQQIA